MPPFEKPFEKQATDPHAPTEEEKARTEAVPQGNHSLVVKWFGTKEEPEFEMDTLHPEGCLVWRTDPGCLPYGGWQEPGCDYYWLVEEGMSVEDLFEPQYESSEWRKQILEKCEPEKVYTWEFKYEVSHTTDWESGHREPWIEVTEFVGDPVLVD